MTLPRRPDRSVRTSPRYSPGTVHSTTMIRSSTAVPDFSRAALRAIDPAVSKAASEESTLWLLPS